MKKIYRVEVAVKRHHYATVQSELRVTAIDVITDDGVEIEIRRGFVNNANY